MVNDTRTRKAIQSRTPAKKVQEAIGLNSSGWQTFLRVTKERAEALLLQQDQKVSSWTKVDYWQQVMAHRDVNQELIRQGLSAVEEDVFRWRMDKAMQGLVKKRECVQLSGSQSGREVGSEDEGRASVPASDNTLPPLRNQPLLAKYVPRKDDGNDKGKA